MSATGHNNPPPHEAMAMHVDDLFQLVSDTTEGAEVKTDAQEAALADLLDQIRQAEKDAEQQRKTEKEPHLEAGRMVDAAWKPVKAKCEAAAAHIKGLLTPYRVEKQRAKDEAERRAREEAEALEKAAQEKLQKPEHLQAKFDAETELKAAKKLTVAANRTAREATGLRTRKVANVTDRRAALNWIARNDADALDAFVNDYARRNAVTRPMDGVAVEEVRVAA